MFRQTLLRAARLRYNPLFRRPQLRQKRRWFASGPGETSPANAKQGRVLQLLDRWIARSPRFLQKPLVTIRHSPTSYITSFAILHELTAIVPLVALACAFHYYRWLPPYFAEGEWFIESVDKIGRWFRRKGWIDADEKANIEEQTRAGKARNLESEATGDLVVQSKSQERGRWVVEIGTAYAIVKLLIPARLVLSAFWAPWFATRIVLPVGRAIRAAF